MTHTYDLCSLLLLGDALPGDCVGSLATASIEDQDVAADTLESDGLHLADMVLTTMCMCECWLNSSDIGSGMARRIVTC